MEALKLHVHDALLYKDPATTHSPCLACHVFMQYSSSMTMALDHDHNQPALARRSLYSTIRLAYMVQFIKNRLKSLIQPQNGLTRTAPNPKSRKQSVHSSNDTIMYVLRMAYCCSCLIKMHLGLPRTMSASALVDVDGGRNSFLHPSLDVQSRMNLSKSATDAPLTCPLPVSSVTLTLTHH